MIFLGRVDPKRLIVLQVWKTRIFKIEEVADNIKFTDFAKQNCWNIILRKRDYGSDDFEKNRFKFDGISYYQ